MYIYIHEGVEASVETQKEIKSYPKTKIKNKNNQHKTESQHGENS